MRRSKLLILLPLPLVGSGCGLFAGPNYMRSRGDAPMVLGDVVSALWMDSIDVWDDPPYAERYGRGELLLVSDDISCQDLAQDDGWDRGGFLWEASGIFATLRYSTWTAEAALPTDASWEGEYWSGVDSETYANGIWTSRWMYSGMFADGTVLELDYARAVAEIDSYDDDLVQGRLDGPLFVARFQAENCGSDVDTQGPDTGDYEADSAGGMQ